MNDSLITFPKKKGKLHGIHWVVILLSSLLTITGWYFSKVQVDEKNQMQFNKEANQVIELISERMTKYEDALWSGVASIQSHSGSVTNSQWRKFADNLRLVEKYPGINGIGIIQKFDSKKEVINLLKKQRKDFPSFRVYPPHSHNEFWPITNIEPVSPNRKALGLDMAHEKNRFSAAKSARDTGKAQMTAPILLVQDSMKTPGFLLFVPFYSGDSSTLENRRKNFIGHVYAPFVMNNLMAAILERNKRHVGISIMDGDSLLYDEYDEAEVDNDSNPLFKKKYSLSMNGRTWTYVIKSGKSFNLTINQSEPLFILFAGIVINILLFIVFYFLTRSNKRAFELARKATQGYERKNLELIEINEKMKIEVEYRKKAERSAADASRAKSLFLANMSHEIRTPMNGIISCTNLLLDSCRDEEDLKLLETVSSCGTSLLRLINDILDFSKLEVSKVELEILPFDFQYAIRSVVDLFSVNAIEVGKVIQLHIDKDVPTILEGDEEKIKQLMSNLLSNAIKFTETDVVVNIGVENSKDNKVRLKFKIKDNGIGISKEGITKLFKSFSQVDGSTTRKYGGSGLGLTICKGLVEIMNGEIIVESEVGIGSTFTFFIELNIAEKTTKVIQEKENSINFNNARKLISNGADKIKILIVEDNLINQMVLKKFLEKLGLPSNIVGNGQLALDYLEENHVDLIFMDKHMPVLDGIEATKEIVRKYGNEKPIIIALTASAMKEDKEICLKSGMDYFLTKPIELDKLVKVIEDCVN